MINTRIVFFVLFVVGVSAIILSVMLTSLPKRKSEEQRYYDCRGCRYIADTDRINHAGDASWNALARKDRGYCGRKNGFGCPNFCCTS